MADILVAIATLLIFGSLGFFIYAPFATGRRLKTLKTGSIIFVGGLLVSIAGGFLNVAAEQKLEKQRVAGGFKSLGETKRALAVGAKTKAQYQFYLEAKMKADRKAANEEWQRLILIKQANRNSASIGARKSKTMALPKRAAERNSQQQKTEAECLGALNCGEKKHLPIKSQETGNAYEVVTENIQDTPIKTQIEQHIVVSRVPTTAGLRAELIRRYREAATRRGFQYHNRATNIYIYIYSTERQARAGQGLWIGMVATNFSDQNAPRVSINQERLSTLSQTPEESFGLSEQERKQVFRDLVAAEDRATREARARIPDSQIRRQIRLQRQLEKIYESSVMQKYGLSKEQNRKISVEGVRKGWVMP